MKPYTVRQLDRRGAVISEKQIEAGSADAVLWQMTEIADSTERIEVYHDDQGKVRQIGADYWRQKFRRSRR